MPESLLGDDGEDIAGVEQEIVLPVVLDFGAAILREDHDIAFGDIERNSVALVINAAGAGGDDLALLRLLLGGVGDDQAGCGGLDSFKGLDEDAILERLDRGCHVKHLSVLLGLVPAEVSVSGVAGRRRGAAQPEGNTE